VRRQKEMADILAAKVAAYDDPYTQLAIKFKPIHKGKGYNISEDRLIVCLFTCFVLVLEFINCCIYSYMCVVCYYCFLILL